jgi:hypothetical protein
MRIEEAIEILQEYNPEEEYHDYDRLWKALKLGIEALKWIYALRVIVKSLPPDKLPGETKSPS